LMAKKDKTSRDSQNFEPTFTRESFTDHHEK
jgi:hypothetical protein